VGPRLFLEKIFDSDLKNTKIGKWEISISIFANLDSPWKSNKLCWVSPENHSDIAAIHGWPLAFFGNIWPNLRKMPLSLRRNQGYWRLLLRLLPKTLTLLRKHRFPSRKSRQKHIGRTYTCKSRNAKKDPKIVKLFAQNSEDMYSPNSFLHSLTISPYGRTDTFRPYSYWRSVYMFLLLHSGATI